MKKIIFALSCLALSACSTSSDNSNNGGSPASQNSLAGLYVGTTTSNRDAIAIIDNEGDVYSIFTAVNDDSTLGGAVMGNLSSTSNTTFESNFAKEFSFEGNGEFDITTTGNYAAQSSIQASLFEGNQQIDQINATYNTAYNQTPSISLVEGNYTGDSYNGTNVDTVSIALTSTGAISGSSTSGCNFQGTAVPDPNGNIYDVSIQFLGGNCINGTQTVNGVATLENGALIAMGLTAADENGFVILAENNLSQDARVSTKAQVIQSFKNAK